MKPGERTARVSTDPDATLALRRGEAAVVLASSLLECDASRRVVAAGLACGETRLAALADPEHDATLCVARASMLPAPAARRVAGWIAGEACVVIELPTCDLEDVALDLQLAARAQRSSADAVATVLDGLADGHIDAQEAARIEAACDRLVRDALSLREVARRVKRERGVVLQMPGRAR